MKITRAEANALRRVAHLELENERLQSNVLHAQLGRGPETQTEYAVRMGQEHQHMERISRLELGHARIAKDRDGLRETVRTAQQLVDSLILVTPTGAPRNVLTDLNIMLLAAIKGEA